MKFRKFSVLLMLFSVLFFAIGCCQNNGTKPSNPFAQNQQTVPPPATFSSQEAYLGQTPGAYIPQTPATTFPPSGQVPSQPQATPPSNVSLSDPMNNSEKAMLFSTAAEKEIGWTAVEVATTSQTAFQAMEKKAQAAFSNDIASESLIVGTSSTVTTIMDESFDASVPTQSTILYSGKYAE